MPGLEISQQDAAGGPVFVVTGPVGRSSVGLLRLTLSPHLDQAVRLDMTGCTRLDLDGLFALAALDQEARDTGGRITLDPVPSELEEYLRQHSMSHLLGETEG